ncbi:hypothetical protein JXR93_03155 [bacterium]|nr:hypothetical protein [bacterium]
MTDNINTRVANFSKMLTEKKDFPNYVLEQFEIVKDAEKKYYEASSPLSKNTTEIKALKEEKEIAIKKSVEVLSIIYNVFKIKKDKKRISLFFGSDKTYNLKSDINRMRDIIDIMLTTNETKQDENIEQYKTRLIEAKTLLNEIISSGDLVGNKKLLKLSKDKAKEYFENEYLRLKHLVIASLIGTNQDYKIFFPSITQKRKQKQDTSQPKTE